MKGGQLGDGWRGGGSKQGFCREHSSGGEKGKRG